MNSASVRLTYMTLVGLSLFLTHSIARDLPAQTVLPKILRNVGFDQRLNEQVPLDIPFLDDEGQPVTLGKYFGDKPVILVLAYYRCPMLCTQVLNGLVQGMREMPFTIGKEFRVVTVSFDPHETTEMAAAKKRTYVAQLWQARGRRGLAFSHRKSAVDLAADASGRLSLCVRPAQRPVRSRGRHRPPHANRKDLPLFLRRPLLRA